MKTREFGQVEHVACVRELLKKEAFIWFLPNQGVIIEKKQIKAAFLKSSLTPTVVGAGRADPLAAVVPVVSWAQPLNPRLTLAQPFNPSTHTLTPYNTQIIPV